MSTHKITSRLTGYQDKANPKVITAYTQQVTCGGGSRNLLTWALNVKAMGFTTLRIVTVRRYSPEMAKVRRELRLAARNVNEMVDGVTVQIW